ncbi:YbaK/EbsC family protein [Vibrio comitans]|uniref:YbaK/aminoacyl-tRNA synthetase-associated domain-containing protein n=1 Tax=Vibrio comitans NBRC 102076 TaxID=1219078 RepID=A0A4Y3IIE4_9VIBR|nr:YbaK/EbsC family protein [Vibrio comitans]GEA59233.1 hypothetical protein VCO01S_04260 [Vibrio comitans NBRC 102076]
MDIEHFLKQQEVDHQRFEHSAVFTIEQANQLDMKIPGLPTKNLFLRDGKGKRHWLWIGSESDELDLKSLSERLLTKRLSLASAERLAIHLDSEPGRVSLLDIFKAQANKVTLLVTRAVWDSETMHCHPYENTATLQVNTQQLKPLLLSLNNEVLILE